MGIQTPLAIVKEKFGDKAKLVDALEKLAGDLWVSRTNKDKGLAHVSNAKLLKLHATFTQVTAEFGSREKLIDAVLDLEKRSKDVGLKQKLGAWPVPRLYDAYKSAAKRARAGAAPAPAGSPEKKTAAKAPKKEAARADGSEGKGEKKAAKKAPAKKTKE